ncbi:helix-turn-helix domain-containing protein [Methylobacterium sp. Gmos1]
MTVDLKKSVGLKVRIARQRQKLTQEELGAQIGRTPESISNIERGLQLPSIETLVELGQALGIPASELLEGVGASGIQHSPKRLELELRLRDITRTLSDRALAVAVAQVDVLLQEQI